MFFLWFRICAPLRHLWLKPAPQLGFLAGDNFLAGHKRPTDGLGVCEDPGFNGFVFGWRGRLFIKKMTHSGLEPEPPPSSAHKIACEQMEGGTLPFMLVSRIDS